MSSRCDSSKKLPLLSLKNLSVARSDLGVHSSVTVVRNIRPYLLEHSVNFCPCEFCNSVKSVEVNKSMSHSIIKNLKSCQKHIKTLSQDKSRPNVYYTN